jgi:protein-L-isoaspartate(D-aspartate) O-methyltransferase
MPKTSADLQRMLDDIEAEIRYTRRMIGRDTFDPQVMEAVRRVPRHEFVDGDLRRHAYDNGPLPIGCGQTISQPYIVALMTELAGIGPGDRVLEVGTGSGYQAAVLAELGAEVFTIEVIADLGRTAAERLERLGYGRVHTRIGDGYHGWKEEAPFDAVVVTAAATDVPPPLVEQLRPGGRMVIPVGGPYMGQDLLLIEKSDDGEVSRRSVLPVAFVPLTGTH